NAGRSCGRRRVACAFRCVFTAAPLLRFALAEQPSDSGLRMMKKWMAVGSLALAALLAFIGFYAPTGYWQSLTVSSATSFLALGIGVIFVNIYLERSARQG